MFLDSPLVPLCILLCSPCFLFVLFWFSFWLIQICFFLIKKGYFRAGFGAFLCSIIVQLIPYAADGSYWLVTDSDCGSADGFVDCRFCWWICWLPIDMLIADSADGSLDCRFRWSRLSTCNELFEFLLFCILFRVSFIFVSRFLCFFFRVRSRKSIIAMYQLLFL